MPCSVESLITAGHDVSDGGVLTCLLEMAFAGNCGVEVSFLYPGDIDDTADGKLYISYFCSGC